MKNSKMAKYDDINETSKNIPDLEFCRKEQKQTSDNIKVGVSWKMSEETYIFSLFEFRGFSKQQPFLFFWKVQK